MEARPAWGAVVLAALFLALTPLAWGQAEKNQQARVLVASALEVNESKLAADRYTFSSTTGMPYHGFRGFRTELAVGYSAGRPDAIAMAGIGDSLRQADLLLVSTEIPTDFYVPEPEAPVAGNISWESYVPFWDAVGPVVVVFENVDPPTSAQGTIYDKLTQTFHFGAFLTVGHVSGKNLLVVWCEAEACTEIVSNLRTLLAEEAQSFLPLIATTRLDEARMDALIETMPSEVGSEEAAALFRNAAFIETNSSRHISLTRAWQTRTYAPAAITDVFNEADDAQAANLAERRAQLVERARSYRDQLSRAADYSAEREQAAYNGRILTFNWLTLALLAAGVIVSAVASVVSAVIAHRSMRQQHQDAEASLSLQCEHQRHARSEDVPAHEQR